MRNQIGQADERFPAGGCAGQTFLKTKVEDQVFPRGVAYRPEVSDGVAVFERLREMPDLAGKSESLAQWMRNRESLSKLSPTHQPIEHFAKYGIRVVVKTSYIRARI